MDERFLDGLPSFARIDAANQDVWNISTIVLKRARMKASRNGRPLRSPEDVDAVDQHGGFVLADVGG